MITNEVEYAAVRQQIQELSDWWSRIDQGGDPLTISNIHRRLATLHQEVAEYKAGCVLSAPRGVA